MIPTNDKLVYLTSNREDDVFRKLYNTMIDDRWHPGEVGRLNINASIPNPTLKEDVIKTVALLNAFDMIAAIGHSKLLLLGDNCRVTGNYVMAVTEAASSEAVHAESYREILTRMELDPDQRDAALLDALTNSKHEPILNFILNEDHFWIRMIVWEYVIFPMFFSKFLRLDTPGLILVNHMFSLIMRDEANHSILQRVQFKRCKDHFEYNTPKVIKGLIPEVVEFLRIEGFTGNDDHDFIMGRFGNLLGEKSNRFAVLEKILRDWLRPLKTNIMERTTSNYVTK